MKGSCCCKSVCFEITEQPEMMGTCHCTRCRKSGASTFLLVKKEFIKIKKGYDFISTYHPEEGYKYRRNFCKKCGSALGEIISNEKMVPVPANTIDNELRLSNNFHEFVSEKPKWYEICDDAKQFLGHPTED